MPLGPEAAVAGPTELHVTMCRLPTVLAHKSGADGESASASPASFSLLLSILELLSKPFLIHARVLFLSLLPKPPSLANRILAKALDGRPML